MNKKMLVGIIIVAGIALGLMAMHTPMKLTNISPLDVGSGNNATEGPHPPSPDAWQIMSYINSLDGPHPPSPDAW